MSAISLTASAFAAAGTTESPHATMPSPPSPWMFSPVPGSGLSRGFAAPAANGTPARPILERTSAAFLVVLSTGAFPITVVTARTSSSAAAHASTSATASSWPGSVSTIIGVAPRPSPKPPVLTRRPRVHRGAPPPRSRRAGLPRPCSAPGGTRRGPCPRPPGRPNRPLGHPSPVRRSRRDNRAALVRRSTGREVRTGGDPSVSPSPARTGGTSRALPPDSCPRCVPRLKKLHLLQHLAAV